MLVCAHSCVWLFLAPQTVARGICCQYRFFARGSCQSPCLGASSASSPLFVRRRLPLCLTWNQIDGHLCSVTSSGFRSTSLPLLCWKVPWQNHAFGMESSLKMQITLRELSYKSHMTYCTLETTPDTCHSWGVLVIFCCVTNYPRLWSLKQHRFIISQILQVRNPGWINWVPLVQGLLWGCS